MQFLTRSFFEHQPFYCEENIWRFIAHDAVSKLDHGQVFFISGLNSSFLMAQQRAGQGELGWIQWDYHVVFAAYANEKWWVFDLDTKLDFPILADRYLAESFRAEIPSYAQAYFRRFSAIEYASVLKSDRSHMRTEEGVWQAPPPPWQAPSFAENNVQALANMRSQQRLGEVFSLPQLSCFFQHPFRV